jgi:hypothetical protein
MFRTSAAASFTAPTRRLRRPGSPIRCEQLENRLMMARITWVNRGIGFDPDPAKDKDGFFAAFGNKAGDARQLVDVAIGDWSFAIQDFKYADTSHTNEFQLTVSAANQNFGLAVTGFQKVDSQGKPFSAEITMDDDANGALNGWFIGQKWLPATSFVNHTDFDGEYNTTNPFRPKNDFYTTVLHEIGHALGIEVDKTLPLRINQFLTAGANNTFNFKAGSTTATFTGDGGGHIINTVDLMNTSTSDRHRRLISPLDVGILRDAYGYTAVDDPANRLPKISNDLPVYWEQFCTYFDLSLPPGLGCVIQASSFPPKLEAIADQTVDEGGTISFDAIARDDNPGEIFVYSLGPNAPAGASINSRTGTFTYTPDDGPATAQITVIVGDNGCGCAAQSFSDSKTFTVTVNNVDPSSSGITGPLTGVRGQPLPFNLTADDVSSADRAAGFTYLIDWGDGTAPQTVNPTANNGAGTIVDHAFALEGFYAAHVKAVDKDGGVSPEASFNLTVGTSAFQPDPNDPTKTAFVFGAGIGADRVRVKRDGKKGIKIELNRQTIGTFGFDGRFILYGQAGDDDIEIADDVKVPAEVYGGDGNDIIKGGGGPTLLLGGADNDRLEGGDDRDILIGGLGADQLKAANGEDIVIGGDSTLEINLTALRAVQTEWLRTDLLYKERVVNIGAGLGGGAVINASTVSNDHAIDILDGGGASDWFVHSSDDILKGVGVVEKKTLI